jgi:hypothetical protein
VQVIALIVSPAGRAGADVQLVIGEPLDVGVPDEEAVLWKKLYGEPTYVKADGGTEMTARLMTAVVFPNALVAVIV